MCYLPTDNLRKNKVFVGKSHFGNLPKHFDSRALGMADNDNDTRYERQQTHSQSTHLTKNTKQIVCTDNNTSTI